MSSFNPLQKYFRQPKIFIALPSKGLYYEPGTLQGDYNNVPIFAMTGMDEIIMKTPDALFSGEAVTRVIESCCPYIKKGTKIPSLDIDALIIAIRIATYGDKLTIGNTCKECETENEFEISLGSLLEHFSRLTFVNNVQIDESLSLKIRPLTYEEMTYFSLENFKLQKTLFQAASLEDETKKQEQVDDIYKTLADIQLQLFLTSIEEVHTPDGSVRDKPMIEEWLRNTDRDVYAVIKEKLEGNKDSWSIPKQAVKCSNCGAEHELTVTLDQANFFV